MLTDFKLIYLLLNPDSSYIELGEEERLLRCLDVLEINPAEFNQDTELQRALVEYEFILSSLPYKKASDALKESIIKKTEWIKKINFDDTDKQGRIKFSPDDHTKAIKALASDLTTQEDFKSKFVEAFKTEKNRFKSTLVLSQLEKSNIVFKEQATDL